MLGILEKMSPSEFVSNGYISNHNKVRRPRPKFKVSFFIFLLFLTQCYSNKLWKHHTKIQRIISDSCSWNPDLMLMLEHPLSHYWTSPLSLLEWNLKMWSVDIWNIWSYGPFKLNTFITNLYKNNKQGLNFHLHLSSNMNRFHVISRVRTWTHNHNRGLSG